MVEKMWLGFNAGFWWIWDGSAFFLLFFGCRVIESLKGVEF